ncbi:uncharacterized protein DS421_4g125840 [Arachis hypogaea]|nr:uncharacterized protein DS421_4g125840 [Arachis hypogaea]
MCDAWHWSAQIGRSDLCTCNALNQSVRFSSLKSDRPICFSAPLQPCDTPCTSIMVSYTTMIPILKIKLCQFYLKNSRLETAINELII